MSSRIDTFFSLAGKHIKSIEKIIGSPLKGDQVNDLGYAIVDILDEGYELSRKDHDSVAHVAENTLYRKGLICEIEGVKFFHLSTSSVRVVEQDKEYEFDLRSLADYKELYSFLGCIDNFTHDDEVQVYIEHNKKLSEASKTLDQFVEVIYWRKVAQSILRHQEAQLRDQKARDILKSNGFSDDEIEGYIPLFDPKP